MKNIPVLRIENGRFDSDCDLSSYTGDELDTQHIKVICNEKIHEINEAKLLDEACKYVNKYIDKNITTAGVISSISYCSDLEGQNNYIEEVTFQVYLD